MLTKKIYDYTVSCGAPRVGRYVTKEKAMEKRLNKTEEERNKKTYTIEQVSDFTLEFLEMAGFKNPTSIIIENITDFLTPRKRCKAYDCLKKQFELNNQKHLVWMKFTKDGYLGVVAASDDINFDINNTSGEIIKKLNQEWDESRVLVFPLPNIGDKERSDIECGIGNYLTDEKGVPILDYYSHRYN